MDNSRKKWMTLSKYLQKSTWPPPLLYHHLKRNNTAGWAPVPETPVKMNYDLEKYPLEIKTDSEVGSGERLKVNFKSSEGQSAGGLVLVFNSTTIRYSA
jgi:hypothetical protein